MEQDRSGIGQCGRGKSIQVGCCQKKDCDRNGQKLRKGHFEFLKHRREVGSEARILSVVARGRHVRPFLFGFLRLPLGLETDRTMKFAGFETRKYFTQTVLLGVRNLFVEAASCAVISKILRSWT